MFNEGWSYVDGSGNAFHISIPAFLPIATGSPMYLKNTIPKHLAKHMVLSFRSAQQSVRIWIDGKRIYDYGTEKTYFLAKGAPSVWNMVALPGDCAGKQIVVDLTSPYRNFSGRVYPFFYGKSDQVENYILKKYYPPFFVSLVSGVFGILMYLTSFILARSGLENKPIRYLGLFVVLTSVWLCSESKMPPPFWFRNAREISAISMMLCPLPYLLYLRERLQDKYQRAIQLFYVLVSANFLFCVILQLTNIADFIETLPIMHILLAVIGIYTIYITRKEAAEIRVRAGRSLYGKIEAIGFIGVALCALIEGFLYYTDQFFSTGFFLRIGLLVYVIALCMVSIYEILLSVKGNARLSEQLQQSKIKLMISQMQPHFLYNTLLAIQELCYTDPRKAADTIVKFSAYLRTNMDFLHQDALISSWQELQHIENYMEIQQIRFGEDLKFVKDLHLESFMIPPLTVQPFVENAVQHGIRKRQGQGTVKLSSWMDGDTAVISIEDNGIGFDTNAPQTDGEFHSMQNIKKRLEVLMKATVQIESTIGEGTRVTIRFPYREVKDCENYCS